MDAFFDTIRKIGFKRGPGRIVGGICAGLAEKLNFNVGAVRVLMLLAFLLPVVGFGAYLIAWILLPWQDGSIPLQRFLTKKA